MAALPPLPPPANRYVTGHNAEGLSVFAFEGPLVAQGERFPQSAPWASDTTPASNTTTEDTLGGTPGKLHNEYGTTCRVVEFPPGGVSAMHRTVSLDYGVVVDGEIELELDDGSTRVLRQGDVVVQRGTMHAWHNKTDRWTRVFFVLVASEKVEVGGKMLEAVILPPGVKRET